MKNGMNFEEFLKKIELLCANLTRCGRPVDDEDKLATLYKGVSSQYAMTREVLENDDDTTFAQAVTSFTRVSRALKREKHEKAHIAHTRPRRDGKPSDPRDRKFKAGCCPFCWDEVQKNFNPSEAVCYRNNQSANMANRSWRNPQVLTLNLFFRVFRLISKACLLPILVNLFFLDSFRILLLLSDLILLNALIHFRRTFAVSLQFSYDVPPSCSVISEMSFHPITRITFHFLSYPCQVVDSLLATHDVKPGSPLAKAGCSASSVK
jgi:hypothetical protein